MRLVQEMPALQQPQEQPHPAGDAVAIAVHAAPAARDGVDGARGGAQRSPLGALPRPRRVRASARARSHGPVDWLRALVAQQDRAALS